MHFLVRGLRSAKVPSGSRAAPGGQSLRKLMGIRKFMTTFLNRNWLKLYHVRHDASYWRCVQWSMIFYLWRKALLQLQYEEQKSKAFACSRKICVILFNAHYPISLRSKEKELIRMFEIVLWRGKWTYLIQNGKEQVKNIHNLTPMPVFTWSGTGQQRHCQSSHRRSWHGPPPFFLTFCLQIYFQSNFFISLLFHLFFPYFNLFVSIFIQSYVNFKLHVSTLYRY